MRETSSIGLAMDASRANFANDGKPETPAEISGQTQRQTPVCTTVIGGETTGSDNLIYIHYAILIRAMAGLHMQKVSRLYHRFQSDVESFQTSISKRSSSEIFSRYKQEQSFLQKEMIYVSK